MGYCLAISLYHTDSCSGVRSFCELAIFTKPGATEFARIMGAKSTASDLVSASTPAFDTEYTPKFGSAVCVSIEEMFTIVPQPDLSNNGTAYLHILKYPSRFTVNVLDHSSSDMSSTFFTIP